MLEQSTYYILDAQGNQLSIYEHSIDSASGSVYYYLTDRNIYGSSRLGVTKDTLNMFNPSVLQSYGVLGNRNYELTDHRGNVQTVINDIKYPLSSDNTSIDSYEVGISSVADYSPFGVQLDGRTMDNVFYHNIESQYEEILVFEDDFEVVSDWEEMTVDTEITYPSGAMRVKNTDSISRRFIGTKHNFIVENGDHTLSFEVKHFPFSVCLAPPIELNDLDNENGENTEVQRPDRMMYLIYIVKSPNNDEILKDSVSATGLYSNITFTPTESGSYTIEFFIRNACNISYFELDNVKITRNGDEIQNLFVANRYRYSFQNQEHHDEIRGKGNYINYKYRGYDPRVGRLDWLIDPLAPQYPHNSPYAFSENRVLDGVELEGLEVSLIGTSTHVSALFSGEGGGGIVLAPDGVYGYGYWSVGLETNVSVGSTITWTRFPDMPAVKHLEGAGAELSVSAGEWAYGSGSIMYADGYVGYSVSIGVGGGVLPVSVSLKGGNTKIKPLTDRSELKYAKEQLSDMRKGLVQDLKNAKSSYNAWNDMVKEEYSKEDKDWSKIKMYQGFRKDSQDKINEILSQINDIKEAEKKIDNEIKKIDED